MQATQFPKRIFVKIENAGSNDAYLHAEPDVEALAEKGQVPAVAEYKLTRRFKVRTRIEEV